MRKDMHKVLNGVGYKGERGYRERRRQLSREPLDDVTTHEPIKRWAKENHRDGKQRRIKYGILKKFLQSKVGQHWDDVYSEVCDVLGKKYSSINAIEYIERNVEINTFMKDGKIYFNPRWVWASYSFKPIEECYDDFYVHPETGLLTKTPKKNRKYRPSKKKFTFIKVNEHEQLHLIYGIWYRITLEQRSTDDTLEMYPIAQQIKKSWGKGQFGWWDTKLSNIFGDYLIPVRKRQLNSQDLKKYKLRNEK